MAKFSVVTLLCILVVVCIILPISLCFSYYANSVNHLVVIESIENAEEKLSYVKQIFEQLADSAQTEAVRISASEKYMSNMQAISSYADIIQDIDLKNEATDVVHQLATVKFADDKLCNVYLYTLGADYILTSDRGILRFDAFNAKEWLDIYMQASAGQPRTPRWASWVMPETDLLSNGSRHGETPIISYILPVRIANSRNVSLLVMNYYETKLASLINVASQNQVYLIDQSGQIICHSDLEMLGSSLSGESHVQELLSRNDQQGAYSEITSGTLIDYLRSDDKKLYVYQHTAVGGWILISESSLLTFTNEASKLTLQALFALLVCLLLGGLICFWGMRHMFRPIQKLSQSNADNKSNVKNEVILIEEQIQQMKLKEHAALQKLLNSQNDVQKLYLLSIWRGIPWLKDAPIQWKDEGFIALALEIDNVALATSEACSILLSQGLHVFASVGQTEGVILDNHSVCLLVNVPGNESDAVREQIRDLAQAMIDDIAAHLSFTFTVGIGLYREGDNGATHSCRHAMAAVRQRMLEGHGKAILYQPDMAKKKLYLYPKATETRILNAIAAANKSALKEALAELRKELSCRDVNSIVQIVHQLNNAIATFLIERNLIDDIFEDGTRQLFIGENDLQTLDELLQKVEQNANRIITYFVAEQEAPSYIQCVLSYLDQHYTEDIDFECMAKKIGISYSYMRRIVKAATNTSVLDLVHQKRMELAGKLLKEKPSLSVRDISEQTGYHNIQSFNRFFKKFFAISPTEYRNIKN